jgi:acyl-CoA synthetase (AMP-forming)/AMP-acid ligase II
MLTLSTRERFNTLLDALTLTEADDRPALIYVATDREPLTITRRDFHAAVVAAARALDRLGLRSRDLVVIAHTQSLESIYAFWGALLLGAIPSMFPTLTEKLDAGVYRRGMAELVRLSAVAAVLTTDDFAPELRAILPCPVYSSAEMTADRRPHTTDDGRQSSVVRHPSSPADVAFLQHSSGTTGLQKGVALSHAAVLNQIAAYSGSVKLCEDDVVVSWLPLYHDMGLIAGFLLPLVQGIPLVLMSPFDWVQHPALLLRAIHGHGGTLCWLPNFAYNHCARRVRRHDSADLSLASMRLFVNCSEPARADSHRLFLERFAENGVRPEMLSVSYAMAENTFAVTQTAPGRPPRLEVVDGDELEKNSYAKSVTADVPGTRTLVSCGPPIPHTEVRVVGQDGCPLPDRRVGQLAIRSNCLLTGYYRRPDLQPFDEEGWYLTGDMGYVAEGEIYVVGRLKDLIINAGKNIYPTDIEAVVNEIPGVHAGRAVAFGVADEREGTELIVVVAEVGTENETERQAIGQAIRKQVARQTMVAVSYVHLVGPKWLLKTSSGKTARGANRDKWLRQSDL